MGGEGWMGGRAVSEGDGTGGGERLRRRSKGEEGEEEKRQRRKWRVIEIIGKLVRNFEMAPLLTLLLFSKNKIYIVRSASYFVT